MRFVHRSDPGADGVGVAFTGAALDLGDRQPPAARAAAFAALSADLGVPVVIVRQVHGTAVWEPPAPAVATGLVDHTEIEADALVTTRPGVALAVRVADCVPILLADAAGTAVAAVHAGRVGLLEGVVGRAVAAVRQRSASPLRAWLGPHVCGNCYEVPPELADDAARRLGVPPTTTRWGTAGIDLGAAATAQLAGLGIPVTEVGGCTLTSAHLHSHRGDPAAGRQVGVVWLTARRAG